ncbi:MAG: DUF3426 domain-containing protein [Alphaproteobacteria bacterium]|nr:DUF3426 domain-containing protein [Alphaproteobacteria bacterium]
MHGGDAGIATAGWVGLAVILFLVGWTAIFFRGDIAAVVPQSATVYKAVGLRLGTSGVQFAAVTNRLEEDGGTHVLIVSGKVVNRTNRELAVPKIRIALTDRHRRELYHWPVTPQLASLKPGESTPFRTRLANPPEDIHQVKVTFARSDE